MKHYRNVILDTDNEEFDDLEGYEDEFAPDLLGSASNLTSDDLISDDVVYEDDVFYEDDVYYEDDVIFEDDVVYEDDVVFEDDDIEIDEIDFDESEE